MARYVVPWPLPHVEVTDNPKTTSFIRIRGAEVRE
jgi:hypothetical protein